MRSPSRGAGHCTGLGGRRRLTAASLAPDVRSLPRRIPGMTRLFNFDANISSEPGRGAGE